MTMRLLLASVVLAVATVVASPAFAQGTTAIAAAKPKPRVPKLPIGYRAYFIVENTAMSASSTFKAVFGSSSLTGVGVGGEVFNLWKKVFARLAVSKASNEGARAFLIDGTLISTGVPLEVGLTTIELSAGWRQYLKKHPRFAFYGGGGLVFAKYSEESPFARPGENTNSTFMGSSVFAGMEALVWKKWLVAGVEGQFRSVPNALGEGGLSKAYGESSLSGASIRAMVGVRYKR